MALLDVLGASREVAGGVTGIVSAYRLLPENPPDAAKLPAVVQTLPADDERPIDSGNSLEVWTYTWELHVLRARGTDIQGEYAAALAFLIPIVAAFRTNLTLGMPSVYDVRPRTWRIGLVSILNETYVGLTFSMAGKEKFAVSFS